MLVHNSLHVILRTTSDFRAVAQESAGEYTRYARDDVGLGENGELLFQKIANKRKKKYIQKAN